MDPLFMRTRPLPLVEHSAAQAAFTHVFKDSMGVGCVYRG